MNTAVKTDLGNKEIFSRNLNRYLRLSGKSQKEVANAVGISPSVFCDWVKGRAYPRMDKVQKLADYFGIRKSDLVEDVYVSKETVTEEDQKALDLLHQVPKDKRELILSMIEAAIKNL